MRDQIEKIIKNKVAAYRVLIVEAIITTVLALLLLLSVDVIAAYSAVLGGLAFVIPNLLFARVVFRQPPNESAKNVIRQLYVGEAIKILATIVIFAACFILVKPVNVVALFAVFVLMMLINLTGLALFNTE